MRDLFVGSLGLSGVKTCFTTERTESTEILNVFLCGLCDLCGEKMGNPTKYQRAFFIFSGFP